MWINHGKFKPNAATGYILKPAVMRDAGTHFNPYDSKTWADLEQPMTVTVKIISARHLVKAGKGVASPYVQVDVCGVEEDIGGNNSKRTQVSESASHHQHQQVPALGTCSGEHRVV
jgi:phosphatidylinositol phospholipase C gamma-1